MPEGLRVRRRVKHYNLEPKRMLLLGGDGIAIEEFLARSVSKWLS